MPLYQSTRVNKKGYEIAYYGGEIGMSGGKQALG